MNERIKQFAEQAFFDENTNQPSDKMYTFTEHKMKQFAELIVRECMEQIHIQSRGPCGDYHGQWFESDILKHFGVEE